MTPFPRTLVLLMLGLWLAAPVVLNAQEDAGQDATGDERGSSPGTVEIERDPDCD
jgi:hypothetical protein